MVHPAREQIAFAEAAARNRKRAHTRLAVTARRALLEEGQCVGDVSCQGTDISQAGHRRRKEEWNALAVNEAPFEGRDGSGELTPGEVQLADRSVGERLSEDLIERVGHPGRLV